MSDLFVSLRWTCGTLRPVDERDRRKGCRDGDEVGGKRTTRRLPATTLRYTARSFERPAGAR
jgi:hypothetical protein